LCSSPDICEVNKCRSAIMRQVEHESTERSRELRNTYTIFVKEVRWETARVVDRSII
jgi:hypothetical protein